MTGTGSLVGALFASLWWDNSTPGRIIIASIAFFIVRAGLATRQNVRRYQNENTNLDRVIQHLERWRGGRQAIAATAADEAVAAPDHPDAEDRSLEAQATAATMEVTAPPDSAAAAPPDRRAEPGIQPQSSASSWHSLTRATDHAAVDIDALREGVDSSSLVWERLDAIAKMRRHQVKINLATLQQLTQAKEAARRSLTSPSFAAGIAMMLGLLGTFIGLAVMAQRIFFALPSSAAATTIDSWTSSFQNVTAVLSGIKIAFSTSLVGIFGAIVATVMARRLRYAQTEFSGKFERFTVEDLLPATVPSVEDESLLERVTLQIENAFLQIDGVFRQNGEAIKEMTGAQEAFVDIVEEMRLITKSDAARNLEGIIEQVAATNRSVLRLVEQLPGMVASIDAHQRRLLDQMVAHLSQRDRTVQQGSGGASPMFAALILAGIVVAVLLVLRLTSH